MAVIDTVLTQLFERFRQSSKMVRRASVTDCFMFYYLLSMCDCIDVTGWHHGVDVALLAQVRIESCAVRVDC